MSIYICKFYIAFSLAIVSGLCFLYLFEAQFGVLHKEFPVYREIIRTAAGNATENNRTPQNAGRAVSQGSLRM
jgi:hypothetical protein